MSRSACVRKTKKSRPLGSVERDVCCFMIITHILGFSPVERVLWLWRLGWALGGTLGAPGSR
eukprot:490940-Prymnesium_polylepis.2